MAKRRWTLVLVPHGSEPSRIIEVSYRALKALGGGAVLGLVALLLLGYATFSRGDRSLADRQAPAGESASSRRSSTELNARLASLSDTIVRISQRDARIRVLANLDPIDPEVQAAGIGGPTIPAPAGDPSSSLRRSHEIRVDLNAPDPAGQSAGLLVPRRRRQPLRSLRPSRRHALRSCRPRAG